MDKMPVVEDYEEEINENDGINIHENEEELPSPRIKMSKEEIFEVSSPRNKKVREPPLINDKKDKITEKKKRPPMSEEHKEKLRQAREKALETRRRNSQEKKEMKELEKKAKEKKKEELKKYVNNEPTEEHEKPREIIKEVIKPVSTITKKDLQEAQLEAIMKYEAMRKQRKKEKQEKEREEKEKEQLKQQINKMVAPNNVYYGQKGYFDNCF